MSNPEKSEKATYLLDLSPSDLAAEFKKLGGYQFAEELKKLCDGSGGKLFMVSTHVDKAMKDKNNKGSGNHPAVNADTYKEKPNSIEVDPTFGMNQIEIGAMDQLSGVFGIEILGRNGYMISASEGVLEIFNKMFPVLSHSNTSFVSMEVIPAGSREREALGGIFTNLRDSDFNKQPEEAAA